MNKLETCMFYAAALAIACCAALIWIAAGSQLAN